MMGHKDTRAQDTRHKTQENVCPGEHVLNDYLTGTLQNSEREDVERHLAGCPYCMFKIAEAYEVLNESGFKLIKESFMRIRKKMNYWLLGCIIMFLLSFLVRRYFAQFLVGATLLGVKWIVDNKNTKMLIMIYDAWKRGGRKEAGRVLESLDSRMKRL